MSYRYYFNLVKKEDVKKIKDVSLKKLIDNFNEGNEDDIEINFDKVIPQKCIHEFGKFYESKEIQETGEPLFSNKETKEFMSYYDYYVVGKEGLLKVIDIYAKKVAAYYKELLNNEAETHMYLTSMIKAWNEPYKKGITLGINLDDNDVLVNGWEYEYNIFNLLHLLKTIDWETYTILFYGY